MENVNITGGTADSKIGLTGKEDTTFEGEVKKYSEVKKKIEERNNKFNGLVSDINNQIAELTEKKAEIYKQNFKEDLDKLQDEEGLMKENLLISFPTDKKSIEFDFGLVYYRVLKSVSIENKEKLLTTLSEKKMLFKAVKSFDDKFLKKGIEMELFNESEAKIVEKKSLVFTSVKGGVKNVM